MVLFRGRLDTGQGLNANSLRFVCRCASDYGEFSLGSPSFRFLDDGLMGNDDETTPEGTKRYVLVTN